jgi:predicted metal-dependent HD superfamily phosphohydrolase
VLKAYEDHPWWPAIELAVWFHDFVYSVDPEQYRQNEVLSAKAMAQCVAALCDGDWTAHHAEHLALAEKIIQATASRAVPAAVSTASFGSPEHAQQLMLDADLAIFAMSRSRLAEYDRQIQQVGQDPRVLHNSFAGSTQGCASSLLGRDRIFGTAEFGRLEQLARVQVAALIERY